MEHSRETPNASVQMAAANVKRIEKMKYLGTLNKKQLQALCREKGIPVTNNNTDMRNRLLYK